jgi:nicotinate-nucleotide adenylyltransferase
MTLAILGGTFNPVHLGHLFLAEEAQAKLGYELVVFVPAHIPVHKDMEIEVGAAHRLAMLELAIDGHPGCGIDDCELRRGGASYTIDTVRDILGRYPVEGRPGLLIGDDLVEGFDDWKEAPLLAEMVQLVVGCRVSGRTSRMRYPCVHLNNALLPVSSSQIRDRLRQGLPIQHLVPPGVSEYIADHGLYS